MGSSIDYMILDHNVGSKSTSVELLHLHKPKEPQFPVLPNGCCCHGSTVTYHIPTTSWKALKKEQGFLPKVGTTQGSHGWAHRNDIRTSHGLRLLPQNGINRGVGGWRGNSAFWHMPLTWKPGAYKDDIYIHSHIYIIYRYVHTIIYIYIYTYKSITNRYYTFTIYTLRIRRHMIRLCKRTLLRRLRRPRRRWWSGVAHVAEVVRSRPPASEVPMANFPAHCAEVQIANSAK